MPGRFSPFRGKKSEKHELTWSLIGLDASTTQVVNLSNAVQPSAKNASIEVAIGSTIRSVYFEFHFSAAQTANVNVVHWKVEMVPDTMVPSIANSYYQTDRRFILKRGMEMLPVNVATVFKRIFVVRIPAKYRRQSEGQLISFRFQASSTQQINACGFAIYKELN